MTRWKTELPSYLGEEMVLSLLDPYDPEIHGEYSYPEGVLQRTNAFYRAKIRERFGFDSDGSRLGRNVSFRSGAPKKQIILVSIDRLRSRLPLDLPG
jgi:hypothetical protein